MDEKTKVKWIGPNDPMIRIVRNDARLYLTKRELYELRDEIDDFISYYRENFTKERIDIETLPEDVSVWAFDYDKKNESTKT